MGLRSGKVYMESPDGKVREWVDAGEVPMFRKENFKVVPVRLRKETGNGNVIERTFMSDRIPPIWANDDSVEQTELVPGEVPGAKENAASAVATSLASNFGPAVLETARVGVPSIAASLIPGAGFLPATARFAMMTGVGGAANMGAQKVRGEEVDPQGAFTEAGFGAALGIPFELAANYLPKWAPRMVSDVLRPSASQQKAMEAVAQRQGGQRVQPDYDRAAQQLLDERVNRTPQNPEGERVMPNKRGSAALEAVNSKTNQSVNDILDAADAAGFSVAPTELVRSPEVREMRRALLKSTDGRQRLAQANARLKAFMENRATQGMRGKPAGPPQKTGLVDQFGNPVMKPGTPAVPGIPKVQRRFTANSLGRQDTPGNEGQKAVWRRDASSISRARAQGTSMDKELNIDALVDDALARAAVRRLENTGYTVPDPESPTGSPVGVDELNSRLERRIPLKETIDEHLRRPPMTFGERIGLLRGRIPFPDAAVLRAAYTATNPGYVPRMTVAGRQVGLVPGMLSGQSRQK